MRTKLQSATKLTLAMSLVASALAFAGAHSAMAQSSYPSSQAPPQADIRLGAYFPSNSTIKNQVGNVFPAAGFDYYLSHNGPGSRNLLSIDYIDRGSAEHRIQMIPVTFGQQVYQYGGGLYGRGYFGYGVGAYFINQDLIDSTGFRETNHTTLYGGYVNAGVDVAQGLFLDLRYHITSSTGHANPGGIEFTGGFRF